jgi:hypothetical protein
MTAPAPLTGTFTVPYSLVCGEAEAALRAGLHQGDVRLGAGPSHHQDGHSLRPDAGPRASGRRRHHPGDDAGAVLQVITSHASSAIWQDVYHVPLGYIVLYVKFTTDAEGYLVISFKDKESP